MDALHYLARIADVQEEEELAVGLYSQVVQGSNAVISQRRASGILSQQGEHEKARRFLEQALELALSGAQSNAAARPTSPESSAVESVWEDEHLGMQAHQPVGNPVVLNRNEAERVLKEFGGGPSEGGTGLG